MDLNKIRNKLVQCENDILFNLILRSNFPYDKAIYSETDSIFNQLLLSTEIIHQKMGRYNNSEEYPFKIGVEGKIVNYNRDILTFYQDKIIPSLCKENIYEDKGSTSLIDIHILQAISRRCHMGIEVAMAKLQLNGGISCVTQSNDEIYQTITNKEVEDKIIQRVRNKTRIFLENFSNRDETLIEKVVEIFLEIIEITKKIQLAYINITTSH